MGVRLNPLEPYTFVYMYKDIKNAIIRVYVYNNTNNNFATEKFPLGGLKKEKDVEEAAHKWKLEKKEELGYVDGQPPIYEGRARLKTEKELQRAEEKVKAKQKA